jgi:hypothetical protein
MDWKKLAEEAQQVEDERAKQQEAEKEPPPPKMLAGDALYHPVLGKCNYAGDRGDGVFFVRGPDGRMLQLSHKLVRITAVPGKPRQYNIAMRVK